MNKKELEVLFKRLDILLEKRFPIKEDRDGILQDAGQIVVLETLDEVLRLLPNEEVRQQFADLVNSEKGEEAVLFAQTHQVSVDTILQNKAIAIVQDTFA